jgi:hypothetical protein
VPVFLADARRKGAASIRIMNAASTAAAAAVAAGALLHPEERIGCKVKRSIIAIVAILPTVAALPATSQASSAGLVQLSSVTSGPLCDKFTLNGTTWAINAADSNAAQRLSLVEMRAAMGVPITVSMPSEMPSYGVPLPPDKIACGAGPAIPQTTFPNASLIQ